MTGRKRRAKRGAQGAVPAMPAPARAGGSPPAPTPELPPPPAVDFSAVFDGLTLSDREHLFVVEYIANGGVASAAYKATSPNCTDGWARSGGCEMKARPDVAEAIRRLLSAVAMSREEVLIELGNMLRDKDGHPIGRVMAATQILKTLGAAPPTKLQVEHSGPSGGPVTFSVSEAIKETLGRDHDLDVARQPIPPEDEP